MQISKDQKIVVYLGDITEIRDTDVIVNAANGAQHTGGLAKAIANKVGPVIQRISDEYGPLIISILGSWQFLECCCCTICNNKLFIYLYLRKSIGLSYCHLSKVYGNRCHMHIHS